MKNGVLSRKLALGSNLIRATYSIMWNQKEYETNYGICFMRVGS